MKIEFSRGWGMACLTLMTAIALVTLPARAQQQDPPEAPPDGPGGPGGPGGPRHSAYKLSGVFSAASGEDRQQAGQKIVSDGKDVSAVYAYDGGQIALQGTTIETSGSTSSQENSSFFGLNAAVLAAKGGAVVMRGGSITTSGEGANGAFAVGKSSVTLADVKIRATGNGGHGVMTAGGGELTLAHVDIDTTGPHGAALATDRGGGKVTAVGGTFLTAGEGSPSLYSTGVIAVKGATMRSTGAEAAVIEGSNSIAVEDSLMESEKLCGVMLYQSFSGDAQGQQSHFTMKGGALRAGVGPAFYVTNTHGTIRLEGVRVEAASGVLLKAASQNRWGRRGQNGGSATLLATHETLKGDLLAGEVSTIEAALESSTLTGRIAGASLRLDVASQWTVTADSQLTALSVADGLQGLQRIHGAGHTVSYRADDSRNAWLDGKSYPLPGGGQLQPAR